MTTKPETCSECDEWHCGDGSDHMTLDNDIYTSVHNNCPLIQEREI